MVITSVKNPLVQAMKSLKDKKGRQASGLFLMEGDRFVKDALNKGREAAMLFCEERFMCETYALAGAIAVSELPSKAISSLKSPQGVYAAFRLPEEEKSFEGMKRILYLDGVQDPDNAGSLVRTAVCAAYDAVISSEKAADWHSPKAVRSSAGAVMEIALSRGGIIALNKLKEMGFTVYASDAKGDSLVEYIEPFALVVGSEGNGVSDDVLKLSDKIVSVKMAGDFESLNAAVAGGILMFNSIASNEKSQHSD